MTDASVTGLQCRSDHEAHGNSSCHSRSACAVWPGPVAPGPAEAEPEKEQPRKNAFTDNRDHKATAVIMTIERLPAVFLQNTNPASIIFTD